MTQVGQGQIVFDPNMINQSEGCFSAVFLSQQSYINLLDLVDLYFNLGMRTEACTLECLPQSYMFITYNKDKLMKGVGKMVSLKLSCLAYSPKLHTVVGFVHLKNNFTDNDVPHIVISKPNNLKRSDLRKLLKDTSFNIQMLHAHYTVHGKIGIMSGSKEESASIIYSNDGSQVQFSNHTVSRPEATISVENSTPPSGAAAECDDEENYMGYKLYKGDRGGKYIIKEDGSRRYFTEAFLQAYYDRRANGKCRNRSGRKNGDVVYNINFLADADQ